MTSIKRLLAPVIDVLLCLAFPWRLLRRRSMIGFMPRRVLVCRTDHIGDVYLSMPALALVRAHYPDAHLTVLVASWAAPLLSVIGCQDELLICDPPWWVSKRNARFGTAITQGGWRALWRTIRLLRSHKFDLCIELRGDVRQIVAFGVLGGPRRLLTRHRNGGAVLADRAPQIDEQLHECDQNLLLVKALGIPDALPVFPTPYSAENAVRIQSLLAGMPAEPDSITIMVHPGAKWINRWPSESYAELLREVGKEFSHLRVLLTGAGSEAALCLQVADALPGCAHVLAGRLNLTETAALMAKVDLVVMADTGPMHFLNALTTPAVLLFGPTFPARFAPRGRHIQVISTGDCCAASLHETCTRSHPGAHSACMAKIGVQEVLYQVRRLLIETHKTKRDTLSLPVE